MTTEPSEAETVARLAAEAALRTLPDYAAALAALREDLDALGALAQQLQAVLPLPDHAGALAALREDLDAFGALVREMHETQAAIRLPGEQLQQLREELGAVTDRLDTLERTTN